MSTPDNPTDKASKDAPHMTYYPFWLDNLADDVVIQGAVFNGEIRGADGVRNRLQTPAKVAAGGRTGSSRRRSGRRPQNAQGIERSG